LALSENEKAEILMKKYGLLRDEVTTLISIYKTHVRHFLTILTAILVLLGYLIGKQQPIHSWVFWLAVSFFTTTAISYVVFDVLQSLFSINVLGARLSVIEEKINSLAGERLLQWETLSPCRALCWKSAKSRSTGIFL